MKTYSWLFIFLFAVLLNGCGGTNNKNSSTLSTAEIASVALNELNLAEGVKYHSEHVVTPTPWVGHWWAYGETGIASGWRDSQGLSPADKYDVAYKSYMKATGQDVAKFKSAADWERFHHVPYAGAEPWWGHCNGWSASAIMTPEPRAPRIINGVEFAVRDLKALLAESWLEFSGDFVGTRVDTKGDMNSDAFWDVVPAQFHLLLVGVVGKTNRSLIIDRYTGYEVWNQPLVAYQIAPITREDYLGPHPEFPNVYRVNVTTRIWWANDNVGADDLSPPFELSKMQTEFYDANYPGRELRYELWLDGPAEFDSAGKLVKSGDIIVTANKNMEGKFAGGVWKNGLSVDMHPDFMWLPFGVQHSSGYKNENIDDAWVADNISKPRR